MILARNCSQPRFHPILIIVPWVCLGVSVFVAAMNVIFNGGFGANDIRPFFLWTLPFAMVVTLINLSSVDLLDQHTRLSRYTAVGMIGGVTGVLWTYFVAKFLGSWFEAFSFPVLSCWIAGGICGMIVRIRTGNGKYYSRLVELALIPVVCLTVVIIDTQVTGSQIYNQQLEVIPVKWELGSEPLINKVTFGKQLPEEYFTQLKAIGLTGQISFAGSGTFEKGQQARVIIVMQKQLEEPVELFQPDGVDVIYIQDDAEWKKYPVAAPVLRRTIRLWPDDRDLSWATLYSVELSNGKRQGGTLFTW